MSGSRCESCGGPLSCFDASSLCITCHSVGTEPGTAAVRDRNPAGTAWLWIAPSASRALATRDLGVILRAYRRAGQLSQRQLAVQLGYDPAYVSLLERGKRVITDRGSLARIARQLAVPPHVLGVTDDDDADFAAMLQFADSVLRLAEVARRSGHAVDAVNELWPLIARLEARIASGRSERDVTLVLAHARVAFGTSLGHILPEERLVTAARWTGRALRAAGQLGEPVLLARVLRMHGNELRKAGYASAGAARLTQALELSRTDIERGETLALLARAAGELRLPALFDQAICDAVRLLEGSAEHTMLFNPFALREIHLRGLLATGRPELATALAAAEATGASPAAPQWAIIERITAADVLVSAGEPEQAAAALTEAATSAELRKLPHQLQRIIRVSAQSRVEPVRAVEMIARAALGRLRALLQHAVPEARS
jgi:transcriptional regulator with XRE-family HTH domain